MRAKKGQWVQIHRIVLKPEERSAQIPDDTKRSPLEMWVKGYINADAGISEECEITTVTGRIVKGELAAVEPGYTHGFGDYVGELNDVRAQLRGIMEVRQ